MAERTAPTAGGPVTGAADTAAGAVAVVWCDFGGVLTSPVADALERVARAAGVPAAELLRAVDRVGADLGLAGLEPLELGLISQREWGARVTAALAPAWAPRVDLGRLGDHWYVGRTPNLALLAALAALRARGIRLGLLTNSVLEWEPHRRALLPTAERVFERAIRSHEVGVRKPDEAIFLLAEDAFAAGDGRASRPDGDPRRGSRFLLIDDVEANCAAAARRGWATIRHTSTASTLASLTRLTAPPR